jgi:hypothetical protein
MLSFERETHTGSGHHGDHAFTAALAASRTSFHGIRSAAPGNGCSFLRGFYISAHRTCRQRYIEIVPQLHKFLSHQSSTLNETLRLNAEELARIGAPSTDSARAKLQKLKQLLLDKWEIKPQISYAERRIKISRRRMHRVKKIERRL